MPKSTMKYFNALLPINQPFWSKVEGTNGLVECFTLAQDAETGDYTRLTRFLPGADTSNQPGKAHQYPEEVYIVSGELFDFAFQRTLVAGDYASRPPYEKHGPFKTDTGCLVLEVSFPSKSE